MSRLQPHASHAAAPCVIRLQPHAFPGYPHEFFVECKFIEVLASAGLLELWRWLRGVHVPTPLVSDPAFEGYGVFRVEAVDLSGVSINFEMYRGEFNINGFMRILTEGEVRTALPRGAPMPNTLRVHVASAVGLKQGSANLLTGELGCQPRVVLRARHLREQTRTLRDSPSRGGGGQTGPGPQWVWAEDLMMVLTDPSTVLHVSVYDDTGRAGVHDRGDKLLGQWVMTLKWLAMDPTYCEHSSLHVEGDGSMRGWFVLEDSKRAGRGECGELLMHLKWSYEAEQDERQGGGGGRATPPPQMPPPRASPQSQRARAAITALEQLTQNSVESQLRLGSPLRAQRYLSSLPYLLDVHRITIRDIHFFVKDLFMGLRGQVEAGSRQPEAVHIALLEMCGTFCGETRDGVTDPGLTIWDFLSSFFFKQVFPKVLVTRGPLWSAVKQSTGGMVHGLHSQHTAFWREVWQGVTAPRRTPTPPTLSPSPPSSAPSSAPSPSIGASPLVPALAAAPSGSPKPAGGLLQRRVAAAAQRGPAPAAERPPPSSFSLWLPPTLETPLGSRELSPVLSPVLNPVLNPILSPVLSPSPAPKREQKTSWLGASYPSVWSLSATASAAADYRSGRANPRLGERRLSPWLSLLAALPEQPLWRLLWRLEQQGEHRAAADAAAAWLEARASASALASTSRTLAGSVGATACCASRDDGARQLAAWYVQRRWRQWRRARIRFTPVNDARSICGRSKVLI